MAGEEPVIFMHIRKGEDEEKQRGCYLGGENQVRCK